MVSQQGLFTKSVIESGQRGDDGSFRTKNLRAERRRGKSRTSCGCIFLICPATFRTYRDNCGRGRFTWK